jgi:hypothetical protein
VIVPWRHAGACRHRPLLEIALIFSGFVKAKKKRRLRDALKNTSRSDVG